MSSPATFDVSQAIEKQKLGGFAAGLIVTSWLVTFFDGFDMNVISFTSKRLEASFHIGPQLLGHVFSIGIFGALLGGFLFGWIGDRLGRRPSIILATGVFSVLTVLLAFARSYDQLLALRFLNGLALGGAIPLIWALNVEFVPRRFRATAVTLVMLGYGFGVAAAGPIARVLLHHYDWPAVFLFGGALSALATLLLLIALPESLRFLLVTSNRPDTVARTLRRMGVAPGPQPGDQLILTDEASHPAKPFRIPMLFQERLRWLTPLLWIGYIASSMSTFFLTFWGPLVLEGVGFSPDQAAWVSSMNSLCGAAGGLAIMRFTDVKGSISIAIMPILAVPMLLAAGLAHMSLSVFFVLSIAISIFLGGSHYAITSIVGLFYPSSIRANGAGWASSMAKVGSVLGPLIGGYVLSTALPVKNTYALLAICPAIYGACVLTIGLIERRDRVHAAQPQASPQPAAAEA